MSDPATPVAAAAAPSTASALLGNFVTGIEADVLTNANTLVQTAAADLPTIATASKPLVAAASMLEAPAISAAVEAGQIGLEELFVTITAWIKSL